jgi:fatty acid desaturase
MRNAPGIAGLRASGMLAELTARNSWRAIVTIAGEYGFIALSVTIGYVFEYFWVYLLVVLVVGTRQYALGECMAHEASHRNLSSTVWLNELFGIAVCWPFFMSLSGYRRFHNRLHHKISLEDEDNSIYEDYEDWGLPPEEVPLGRWAAFWHLVVKPLVGIIGVRHLMKTLEDFYWDGDLVETKFMLTTWVVIFAAAAMFGLLAQLFLYWIIPWLVVVPVLNYWSEVGDHYRVTGAKTRSNLNWLLNTLIAHNIGYHGLHHHHPSIPWFRLPMAYRIFRNELVEQVSDGYVATYRQILAAEPAYQEIEIRHPRTPLDRR